MTSNRAEERRRLRAMQVSPYIKMRPRKIIRIPLDVESAEVKRQSLLSEKQRVMLLPKGNWSRHRLKVIEKALEMISALGDSENSSELQQMLKALKL